MWLATLAFRAAVPGGAGRRYTLLALLLPTLLYWPSAVGKDAWMVLWIGVCLFGAAHVFTGRPVRGLLYLALGLAATATVRPHVTVMLFAAFAAAVMLRAPHRQTSLTPVLRVAGMVLLAVGTIVLLRRAADYIGADSVSADAVVGAVGEANVQTEDGGSLFTPVPLTSPLGMPAAFATVLFRPFPFEAHNAQAVLASLEGVLALWLTWCYRWSIAGAVVRLRQQPWVTMCFAYVVLFVVAFSGFANFGIISRQRCQVYLAFLALLCVQSLRDRPPQDSRTSRTVPRLTRTRTAVR
jgi:hypothetical protein